MTDVRDWNSWFAVGQSFLAKVLHHQRFVKLVLGIVESEDRDPAEEYRLLPVIAQGAHSPQHLAQSLKRSQVYDLKLKLASILFNYAILFKWPIRRKSGKLHAHLNCDLSRSELRRPNFKNFKKKVPGNSKESLIKSKMSDTKEKILEAYRQHCAQKREELLECFEQERMEWHNKIAALQAKKKAQDEALAEVDARNADIEERERKVRAIQDQWNKALQDYRSLMADLEKQKADAHLAFQATCYEFKRQLLALNIGNSDFLDPGEGTSQQATASQNTAKEENRKLLEKLVLVRQRIEALPPRDLPDQAEEVAKLEQENNLLMEVINDLKRRKDGAQLTHLDELKSRLNWLKLELIDRNLADPNEICEDEEN